MRRCLLRPPSTQTIPPSENLPSGTVWIAATHHSRITTHSPTHQPAISSVIKLSRPPHVRIQAQSLRGSRHLRGYIKHLISDVSRRSHNCGLGRCICARSAPSSPRTARGFSGILKRAYFPMGGHSRVRDIRHRDKGDHGGNCLCRNGAFFTNRGLLSACTDL